ncbi:MAG: hypothetical protein WB780_07415 [Candidatus Acidiferrales bacterium]
MRTAAFHAARLVELFRTGKIATMAELKAALGTKVDLTVFRKLKELGYRTSYSHRGGYYTLREIALFNDLGLWLFRGVWFSRYGTLVKTCEAFVTGSEAGYFAEELDNVLHVETKAALLNLFRAARVGREEISGRYLYASPDPAVQEHQVGVRRSQESKRSLSGSVFGGEEVPNELRAKVILYFSLLDEKQRRLYAGLESLKLGYGGDRKVAEFLGMDPHTVARGREQLLAGEFERGRSRKPGAGRKPVEKKRLK